MSQRQLHLNAFLLTSGHHVAAWRHPDAQADAGLNLAHFKQLAQTAERGKFDGVFFADGVAVWDYPAEVIGRSGQIGQFEPLTLLSALSTVTERIGLIATASTTYNEPYHLARKFASIDHLSGGRAGWNLVTSATDAEARNFNREAHLDHGVRYERAREFYDVVTALWDSWGDDAFIRDKQSGQFFDATQLHAPHHKGEHFSVRGPLNIPRPPQGHPVVVQAGSSEAGRELAAQTAEVIFTAQQTLDDAQAFYADVKARLARYGRSTDSLKILPGISPIIGRTEDEAQQKFAELQALIDPRIGVALLSGQLGFNLSGYPLDGPLPDIPETNGHKSRQALVVALARRDGLTIRQLAQRVASARGHWTVVGTPESIADQLELWFREGGADGFNVMPPVLPTGLNEFVDLVVPELQRRGLFRTEYAGKTLREHLGLPRPISRHARPQAIAA
ncbi:LLM class flavin-dependent oxidoreductase [Jeongeupia naejangsanensis]|uniref:LLM class flavin-dependent oxidoreductase n=1 Tax=Jeongeupia naejangsanensis TaxID=613195 RepID=A0ABS2BPQ6_9NEIS|nr:LLM class flavin-dependent oxidoreductase [Jeongeupia naejangsanensis]MBM3117008.1 LLM class flavin-dependent oxidoreductase [Jeongeupia naejangsanensis]